jgi:hypothetical protein
LSADATNPFNLVRWSNPNTNRVSPAFGKSLRPPGHNADQRSEVLRTDYESPVHRFVSAQRHRPKLSETGSPPGPPRKCWWLRRVRRARLGPKAPRPPIYPPLSPIRPCA